MHCSVCKGVFIVTKTQEEYNTIKKIYDSKIEIEKEKNGQDYMKLWNKILWYDALLLEPRREPLECMLCKKAFICMYCCFESQRKCPDCFPTIHFY